MSGGRPRPPDSRSPAPRPPVRVRDDTIVAIATAPGRSGIAIVRVSGPRAEEIGRVLLQPWPSTPRTLVRCIVRDPGNPDRALDEALAVVFPAPASYTGETVVEVHTHGGPFIPTAVHNAFVSAGARPAVAGEFTERAVLNGKLDVIRAEAIGELIAARTSAAHRSAMDALSGTLMRAYAELRDAAIHLDALIAYDIDFPDEDGGAVPRERVQAAAEALAARLRKLVESAPAAILGRDGAVVVLAGPPNAGKSTLLNALTGEARAIVSEQPGTTRDAIEVFIDGDPWPLRLVDTAGLRAGSDAVERLGIEVSERYLRGADVVVLCADSDEALEDARVRISALSTAPVIQVHTKSDLAPRTPRSDGIAVSALAGEGLDRLRGRIMEEISRRVGAGTDFPVAAISARQRVAIEAAHSEVELFAEAWRRAELPASVAAAHVRGAIGALDNLIGVVDADDVLSRVFSTFCVGK